MKFVAAFRVLVLSLLVVAAGTVQPKTIQLREVTHGKWADVLKRLGGVPSTKLVLLDSLAKNDLQNADVQDYTAQIIQDTFANFNNYTPGSKSKLIRIYKKLLKSPLLRDEQRAFLQNTVLATVAPTVQQLPAQAEVVAANNDLVEVHNTLVQSGVAPTEVSVLLAQPTAPTAPVQQVMTLPEQTMMTAEPIALPMAQAQQEVAVLKMDPVAQVAPAPALVQAAAPVVQPSGLPVAAIPTASGVSESTVNAITQNDQMNTASKAVALTNLINTTTAPVDVKTSTAVAQAVQDVYNAQSAGDAAHVSVLLAAATQKPVLTQEQNSYVKSTLMPVAAQQLAASPAVPVTQAPVAQPMIPVANVATTQFAQAPVAQSMIPVNNPGVVQATSVAMPVSIPAQQMAMSATAPAMAHDLEETMKNLYRHMQAAQGQSFDSATQGTFGAHLVEAFNGVVELQSYMSQLLTAAQDTPLLNDAQHNYVRDVMMPNLDQVSSATPTKTLDQMAAKKSKKSLKKGKNKNKSAVRTFKKKRKGKRKAHVVGAMPKHGKKKKNKKNKKLNSAAHAPVAAVPAATATGTGATTA